VRRSAAALAVTVLAALACGDVVVTPPGAVSDVRIFTGECGGWRAEVDYVGAGVVVLVNGQEHDHLQPTPVTETFELRGEGRPGELVRVAGRGRDGAVVEETLTLAPSRPPVEIALKRDFSTAKRLRAGTPAQLHVAGVLGGCDMEGWSWTATLPDGTTHGPVPLEFMGADVDIAGTKQLGPKVVKVDFVRADGATWTEELRYDVVASTDADRDGHEHADAGGDDCDDDDKTVHALAVEREDGKDQDCNGLVDDHTNAYDDDRDGYSENDGDCHDADASRAPGLAETPDCRDQDCDGEIDEGLTRASTDDRYEPNDASDRAWHLGSDPLVDIALVTREKADEEWFLLTTKDHHVLDEPLRAMGSILAGSLDGWRLKVVAHQLPDDAVYDVEFWHGGAKMGSGTLSEEGQKVRMPGSVLRDDSGAWHVRIVPVKAPREWCPVELRIRGD
jgi:hypothetical protein